MNQEHTIVNNSLHSCDCFKGIRIDTSFDYDVSVVSSTVFDTTFAYFLPAPTYSENAFSLIILK
jgi:hypothetical protein